MAGSLARGADERDYSTLNLMAHCRQGELGYNHAELPRIAITTNGMRVPAATGTARTALGRDRRSGREKVCERLPDCPHFHVVFTVPEEFHEFFEVNYRIAADLFFAAAAETLKLFQSNNWRMEGGFLAVLHTWGSALNWHPHLHLLVSAGGRDAATGSWRQARANYLFPVRAMSKVFRAIMLRRIEELDAPPARCAGRPGSRPWRSGATGGCSWPAQLEHLQPRRRWATPGRWCATWRATPAASR